MSAHTGDLIFREAAADFGTDFLQKPFTTQMLETKVREVLDTDLPRRPKPEQGV
jgi:FixJ family two-component response regulator